jgi:hypothetical protein
LVYIDNNISSCPKDTKLYYHYNDENGAWKTVNSDNLIKNNTIDKININGIINQYMNRADGYKRPDIQCNNPEGDEHFTESNKDELGSMEKRSWILK